MRIVSMRAQAAILFVSVVAFAGDAAAKKDTPVPADGQCNFVNYYHSEAKNAAGAGKCANDCDCDGMRSCVSGACTGKARPAKLTPAICNSQDYYYRESWAPAGAGKCSSDCECDGQRTCASGQCTGTARDDASAKDTPVPADGQCDFVNYHHNETKNAKGSGKCAGACDCDGMRSCVSGLCTGKARPEKLTAEICNSKDYYYRESWAPAGAGKCSSDCECDGQRTCVSGQCKGAAR